MKKVLIIGATSAIAEQCARIWATRGAKLYLVARNTAQLYAIGNDLKVRGASEVSTNCIDLNNIDRHVDLLDAADNTMGGVDIALIAHGTLSNQKSCESNVEETLAEIQTHAL
jgi:short-subunit dehydrogenase